MRPHSLIWHLDNAVSTWLVEWFEFLAARKAARARRIA